MLNLGQLAHSVQKNCNISDARHAGNYTLCVFLLKMREFYRWENEIPFTSVLKKEEISEWLAQREQMWDELEATPFEPLPLENDSLDPFDTVAVNNKIIPLGYVYSGGYGRFGKPHFFIGDLVKTENRSGYTVYISSCEYARDLVAPPAMLLGQNIYVRQESVRRFIWERIEESQWGSNNPAMEQALREYQFGQGTEVALARMTCNETETMVLHELGEAKVSQLLGENWENMLAEFSRSKIEITIRAIRDLLADCLSTLPRLIERDNRQALHFYFANYAGMRRQLYPQALEAYRHWVAKNNINPLSQITQEGADYWLEITKEIQNIFIYSEVDASQKIEFWLTQQIPGFASLKH